MLLIYNLQIFFLIKYTNLDVLRHTVGIEVEFLSRP